MTITRTITGMATDPSNQVMVGANVKLTNDHTAETRTATTNELGNFILPATLPGQYSLIFGSYLGAA
jgi:hypothetical protein